MLRIEPGLLTYDNNNIVVACEKALARLPTNSSLSAIRRVLLDACNNKHVRASGTLAMRAVCVDAIDPGVFGIKTGVEEHSLTAAKM